MTPVFVDTGAWIALVNVRDAHAAHAAAWYRGHVHMPLVTTNYVLDEAVTRLRYDAGMAHASRLRAHVKAAADAGTLRVAWIDAAVENKAWVIFERFAALKLSFTDATSAVVAKQHKAKAVFGFDRDFRALGFDVQPVP